MKRKKMKARKDKKKFTKYSLKNLRNFLIPKRGGIML